MGGNSWQYRYATGWLLNEIGGAGVADWTNVHLGSNPKTNSNITHNLNAPLSDLLVKLFISADGTDANSVEILSGMYDTNAAGTREVGITIYQIDLNNIKVQTAAQGLWLVTDSGSGASIDNQNWYYQGKVWFLG